MNFEDVQPTSIKEEQKKTCKLSTRGVDKYYVKKTRQDVDGVKFFASLDKEFKQSEIDDFQMTNKDELGYAECKGGIVDQVAIRPYPGIDAEGDNDARRCGIGTILSYLCMIDKDVNPDDQIIILKSSK